MQLLTKRDGSEVIKTTMTERRELAKVAKWLERYARVAQCESAADAAQSITEVVTQLEKINGLQRTAD